MCFSLRVCFSLSLSLCLSLSLAFCVSPFLPLSTPPSAPSIPFLLRSSFPPHHSPLNDVTASNPQRFGEAFAIASPSPDVSHPHIPRHFPSPLQLEQRVFHRRTAILESRNKGCSALFSVRKDECAMQKCRREDIWRDVDHR